MKKPLFYAIALVLVSTFLEGSAILFYLVRSGVYQNPAELYQNPNLILQAFNERDCKWGQTLVPHPYLAYLHIPGEACKQTKWNFNRLGFFGEEIPLERDERFFDILLTGGSVAAFLGQMSKVGPNFLELALNENYRSPTGRPFRVLNGAIGGWQQPNQLITAALHGPAVSAIVTLEGFNELQSFFNSVPFRLSRPGWPTHEELVEPIMRNAAEPSTAQILGYFGTRISNTPLIGQSAFVFALYDLMRSALPSRTETRTSRRKDFDASFAFPKSMTTEDRIVWNLKQYRHFLAMIDAMAERMKIRSVFFLQPAPRIDKPLTQEEIRRMSHRQYAEIYTRIVDDLLTLRGDGVEVISLLDTYSGMTQTIYNDTIHPRFDWVTGESKGLRILADRMARELADVWRLEAK